MFSNFHHIQVRKTFPDERLHGDTVFVGPGTYVENVNFFGKAITVKSSDGPKVTVIDGCQVSSVVSFNFGENQNSALDGFLIINGSGNISGGNKRGGGLYCEKSSPVISNNIITGNSAYHGGAISCYQSSPVIINNKIVCNSSDKYGGGIFLAAECYPIIVNNSISGNISKGHGGGIRCGIYSSPFILNNIISKNSANGNYSSGGGIFCEDWTSPIITNNTITMKFSGNGGGGFCGTKANPIITNTIIWGNESEIGSNDILLIGGDPTITYSDLKGGYPGTGNIDADPLFVDPANGDFHLIFTSPCKDTGDNSPIIEITDNEGDPRIAYGTVDMGSDEFYTHLYHAGDTVPGGNVQIKFVGLPGASLLALCAGTGVLDNSILTNWGDWWNKWWLEFPIFGPFILGSIPSDGVYA